MNSNQLSENEYAPFYKNYIKGLGEVNLFEILPEAMNQLLELIDGLPEEKLKYRYAEGKWTIKELIQHIIDAERVLSYRALRFSRNDATDLPGFDEDWYVDHSNGHERSIEDLLEEFQLVRKSSIALFKSFSKDMLMKVGSANTSDMSVRALGFIIAGHQVHHTKVIAAKYI